MKKFEVSIYRAISLKTEIEADTEEEAVALVGMEAMNHYSIDFEDHSCWEVFPACSESTIESAPKS